MSKFSNLSVMALLVTMFITVDSANAQVEIIDYSIDGGGGISSGGNFTVQATIGQPDAGTESSGGNFTVTGGYAGNPDILLGDVNGDGVVNLLDVAPFVEAVTSGMYIPAADVNQDGAVDLLDVAPFVELLSG